MFVTLDASCKFLASFGSKEPKNPDDDGESPGVGFSLLGMKTQYERTIKIKANMKDEDNPTIELQATILDQENQPGPSGEARLYPNSPLKNSKIVAYLTEQI
jgi:hypothetical protein